MNADLPLVSIIVITYNSSKYVLETLESAKAQTYQNIELIISDDGSQDQTVELCERWLADNKERFVHSRIITVEKNTGIPANCNRGVKASKGEWIKLIAGDDLLVSTAIESIMKFSNEYPKAAVIQSLIEVTYNGKRSDENCVIPSEKTRKIYSYRSGKQLRKIIGNNFVSAPGIFMSRKVIENVSLFDEDFKILEDFPMWLKILKSGCKIYLLNEITVLYRKHPESVSATVSSSGITPFETSFLRTNLKILNKYRYVNPFFISLSIFKYKFYLSLNNSGLKKTRFTDLINKLIYKLF